MGQLNLALGKSTKASSYVMPYEASRAVNGTISSFSRWLCNTSPCYFRVDLGFPALINRWVVRHMGCAGWQSPDYNMCDFKLQGSYDDANWFDIDIVTNNTAAVTDRIIPIVNYRFFRLYVTRGLRTNPNLASCMELEVYAAPGLQALNIASGTLVPSFTSTNNSYSASVNNEVSSITVTPIALDPANNAIAVNGVFVRSGQPSQQVPLNVGVNTITVVTSVASSGGTLNNAYTIVVTRLAPTNPELSGLTISTGNLNPTFASGALEYNASVGFDVKSITVTPTTNTTGATITVNGETVVSGTPSGAINLQIGANNIINIAVTNSVGTKTYVVTVTRASSPYLTKVDVSYKNGKSTVVCPISINKNQTEYTVDIIEGITSVTITAYSEEVNAKILVNGNQNLANGQISTAIVVNVGETRIPINVTSNIGTDSKEYGIKII